MTTPYEEGMTAGYKNGPKHNPYAKGWQQWQNWAEDWAVGYEAGQQQALADIADKHISNCR